MQLRVQLQLNTLFINMLAIKCSPTALIIGLRVYSFSFFHLIHFFMQNLVSEFLIKYSTNFNPSSAYKVTSSTTAAKLLRDIWEHDLNHVERFYILSLNRANCVVSWSLISLGGMSGTVADGKVIFQKGLLSNAHGLIMAHNHPSGQLMPSQADISLTQKMVEFGKFIDLPILDHIILTQHGYYSFADEGKI
jgi:DNA repair protein RadC